jgi:hypothetical protein
VRKSLVRVLLFILPHLHKANASYVTTRSCQEFFALWFAASGLVVTGALALALSIALVSGYLGQLPCLGLQQFVGGNFILPELTNHVSFLFAKFIIPYQNLPQLPHFHMIFSQQFVLLQKVQKMRHLLLPILLSKAFV